MLTDGRTTTGKNIYKKRESTIRPEQYPIKQQKHNRNTRDERTHRKARYCSLRHPHVVPLLLPSTSGSVRRTAIAPLPSLVELPTPTPTHPALHFIVHVSISTSSTAAAPLVSALALSLWQRWSRRVSLSQTQPKTMNSKRSGSIFFEGRGRGGEGLLICCLPHH